MSNRYTSKYSDADAAQVKELADRYTTHGQTGRPKINWDQMLAENPEVFERFGNSKKAITQFHFRNKHGLSPGLTRWSPEHLAEVLAVAEEFKGPDGSVDWSKAIADGRLTDVIATHGMKQTQARYSFERNKHKYKKKAWYNKKYKKQQQLASGKAIKAIEADVKQGDDLLVEAARKAEVERQLAGTTTQPQNGLVHYCPRCGLHIDKITIKE